MRLLTIFFTMLLAAGANPQSTRFETAMRNGQAAFEKKQLGQAEKYFKTALKEAERAGLRRGEWAEAIERLADVHIAQRKYADVERLYERVLNSREEGPDASRASLAQSFDDLGDLYGAQGRPTEADRLHARAKEIRDKMLAVHPEVYVDGQPKTVRPRP